MIQRIDRRTRAALHDVGATRRIEQTAAASLPPHTLMQRAGLAVARLTQAVAPHSRVVWVACGPGNNGGDGLEAALQLHAQWHRAIDTVVTWLGDPARASSDTLSALQRVRSAGIAISAEPPERWDCGIDALLGIGAERAPAGVLAQHLVQLRGGAAPLVCIDVPSALDADTGHDFASALEASPDAAPTSPRHCLSLLTLKPGLFTANGRDRAGTVWFDDLGCNCVAEPPAAMLPGAPDDHARADAAHVSHKGSFGTVAVLGGASGMAGAALLCASAALHAGAGRVLVGLLDRDAARLDPVQPELMLRDAASLDIANSTVVAGCGGGDSGADTVAAQLPRLLSNAPRLVLDADALNAIARDAALQSLLRARAARARPTVLTPHPLEAARLIGTDASAVQRDRFKAARDLAARFACVVVLKGSGTLVAGPDASISINPTGNARLATAGTGDVLAGMIGAALARGMAPDAAARAAVWQHGALADDWPANHRLTAGALARGSVPSAH
ncbi:MAG: NAD(P)H-hydrate dehydratase [Variovorax sp.]